MTLPRHSGGWAIFATFVVAFLLTALPLPDWAQPWRPAWVTLVLTYWCLAVPLRVGVVVGWTLGLFLDVMTGTLLGQHALGLTLVAYVAQRFHLQVRVLPVWQQGITVFLLVVLERSLALWVRGLQGLPAQVSAVWAGALTSTLLWPWLFVILRDLRRRYHVF